MATPSARKSLRRALLPLLCIGTAGCAEEVRVPLAVPVPAIGGTRPAGPVAAQLLLGFGDGLWGQEQERAEIASAGLAASLFDRVEGAYSIHRSTRAVRDGSGNSQHGAATNVVRAKVRLADFAHGRMAIGAHVAHATARRTRPNVQDDHLTAVDVAFPLEVYTRPVPDHRAALYAAPRMILESFEDRILDETERGTLLGATVGFVGRLENFSLAAELTVLRRGDITYRSVTPASGWIALPLLELRAVLPLGR